MKYNKINNSNYIGKTFSAEINIFSRKNTLKFLPKLIGILIIFGTLSALSSCTKWLDLKPESETVLDDFWQNEGQATAEAMSCYKALTWDGCMRRIMLWGEGRSDNVIPSPFFIENTLYEFVYYDFTEKNTYCNWGDFYTVINYCNTFLYYAHGVMEKDEKFTLAKYEGLKAEVLTVRALAYFYLVRMFQNVPWIDKPSIDDSQDYNVAQAPEDSVLNLLIQDLKIAKESATSSYSSDQQTKGRITKNAVMALLADIYLWQGDYNSCIEQCDNIIANPGLKLVEGKDVINKVFYKGNSSESIFELQFGDEDGLQNNYNEQNLYGYLHNYPGRLMLASYLYSGSSSPFNYQSGTYKESVNDLRLLDFIYPVGSAFNAIYKYAGVARSEISAGIYSYPLRNNSSNWIVYRLSDIMLMKAEALVQLNRSESDLQEALKIVNTTYLRSNTETGADSLLFSSYPTQGQMEKLVLRERQRELLFEGKRWFDLARMARRANSLGPMLQFVSLKFNENYGGKITAQTMMDALYLPVYFGEMNANNKLVQNRYYQLNSINNK